LNFVGTRERAGTRRGLKSTLARGPDATIRHADRAWKDTVRARNDRMKRSCRTFHSYREAGMTAYLIALALVGLVSIAVWEGFQ